MPIFYRLLCGCLLWQSLAVSLVLAEEGHWAYRRPVRPTPPPLQHFPPPENPIDAFILARLEAAGLTPSPEAAPETLLRRLHLDLIGLPPSLEECEAFAKAWAENPERARRELVDRLLASPHFGEKWGRHWLDLARYADSDGYLGDTERQWAWLYRDWVVEAFNRDLPYDQFSIEQLAGDLLPQPTREQLIATGFHRNSLRNTEAGVDLELARTQEVIDRVNATGTVWLGLTVACAECHHHKHDAIRHEEYYQLYAFFNNTEAVDLPAPFPEEAARHRQAMETWEKSTRELETLLTKLEQETLPARRASWEAGLRAQGRPDSWQLLSPVSAKSGAGDKMEIREDGSIFVSPRRGKDPDTVTYNVEALLPTSSRISALCLEVIGAFGEGRQMGYGGGRGRGGEFELSNLSVQAQSDDETVRPLTLAKVQADYAEPGVRLENVLDPRSNEGWHVARNTHLPHSATFILQEGTDLPAGSKLLFTLRCKQPGGKSLRHFRLSFTSEPSPAPPTGWTREIADALAAPPRELSPEAEALLAAYHRATDPDWSEARLRLETHLARKPAPPATKAQTLSERREERRETHVHVRGDYTRQGERVHPGTPAALHPFRPRNGEASADRLDLARWLFEEGNPLTPRVAVNQIWQQLFGEGIVATSDDFGTEGSPPSHPDLLDWLAVEFRELGWSRKALIRQIVDSEAYRRQSALPPLQEGEEERPPNTLLWRQNPFRIDAELVRDLHLAASGLLSPKLGGPSIRPPLPDFVTEVGRSVKWPVSEGEDRYRRGLYIFLKRTVLYPSLISFDAPGTETACSRRERSNSPMQALTLLNDPVFYECAEALGSELAGKYGDRTEEALEELYRRCLGRRPERAELDTLLSAHADLAQEGNREAALVATARIVMNLDEFITRE